MPVCPPLSTFEQNRVLGKAMATLQILFLYYLYLFAVDNSNIFSKAYWLDLLQDHMSTFHTIRAHEQEV